MVYNSNVFLQYFQRILDDNTNSTDIIPINGPLNEILQGDDEYSLGGEGGEEFTNPLDNMSQASMLRNSCWDPNTGLGYARKCKQACRTTFSTVCSQRRCPNGVYNRAYAFCRITCRLKFCV